MTCSDFVGVVRAVLNESSGAGIAQWRQGVDVHHARHGVASEKCALRSAKHLHFGDVHHVEVVVFLAQHRHIVDVQSQCRLVDARAQSTHIYGGGHAAAVVGNVDVGHHVGCRLCASYSIALQVVASDFCCRNGKVANVGALFDSRHGHLLQVECVGGG